ncbi:thiamine phosphate synthase [Pedobacter sp. MW01-1-1]|uniref:thiamine phosphate synthase n=1 Tax=Pedobacter sp. MW01-1-1 TaxID=3383027 RepID=UPI003FEF58BB
MELVVLSHPECISNEAKLINSLFEAGMDRFHLRKPTWESRNISSLLKAIQPHFHPQIALHQHHVLRNDFAIQNLHFQQQHRIKTTPEELMLLNAQEYTLSTSFHDLTSLKSLSNFQYAFFSPVFKSLSKPNYPGKISDSFQLEKKDLSTKIIALGGISDTNLKTVKEMNFDGAAILGALWIRPEDAVKRFKKLNTLLKNMQHD